MGVGNLTISPIGWGNQTFGYDNLYRLMIASYPLLATPQVFVYNAVNRLLSKTLPGGLVTSHACDTVGKLQP